MAGKQEHRKDMKKTYLIIIALVVVAIVVMAFYGVFDDTDASMQMKAESVCFMEGKFDGVSEFNRMSPGVYNFTCDNSKSTMIYFDGSRGKLYYEKKK